MRKIVIKRLTLRAGLTWQGGNDMIGRHIATALVGLALVASPAFAQKKNINAREHRQTQRIKDGKEDGQLTKGEQDKLKADEAAVRAEEKVYRKSGDGLNKA